MLIYIYHIYIIFLSISRIRGRERERVKNIYLREKHRSVASSLTPPPATRDPAHNLVLCPDWNEIGNEPSHTDQN